MTDTSQPNPHPKYRQRLAVYVVWHPDFQPGATIAESLYADLSRVTTNPTARGMGIPVLFRYHPEVATGIPADIPFDECYHTAVVVLVDDAMAASDKWSAYVEHVWRTAKKSSHQHRVYPVKLSPNAFNLSQSIAEVNFIRPLDGADALATAPAVPEGVLTRFTTAVAHELCRLLLAQPRLNREDLTPLPDEQKVTIFISHTKADGEQTARAIKRYIQDDTQLRTFFDANDIPYGEAFDPVLRRNIQSGALLIVETDLYASSVWCLHELLEAKKHRRPILVVNAAETVERSSVYIGNVPIWRHAREYYPRIVKRMVLEVLRREHFIQHFNDLKELFQIPGDVEPLPYPPEPLTIADLRMAQVKAHTFVYPDPPLNRLELERLGVLDKRITVTTPLLLLATGGRSADESRPGGTQVNCANRPAQRADEASGVPAPTDSTGPTPQLHGLTVGLSIGASPDLPARGMGNEHFNDAVVAFALYLLASGADLAYGGVPQLQTKPGQPTGPDFLDVLLELILAYTRTADGGDVRSHPLKLRGFIAEAFAGSVSSAFRARWKHVFDFKVVSAGVPVPAADATAEQRRRFIAWSLSAMRRAMNAQVSARVLLGGKLLGSSGAYPGIIEESYLAMRESKPVYLVGSFGGAAGAVIDVLEGRPSDAFKPAAHSTSVAAPAGSETVPRLHDIADFFRSVGVRGLAATNGLTEDENRRLFHTPHVPEMVFLVLRGLSRTRPASATLSRTSREHDER